MSFTSKILIGLCLGIFTGLFLGSSLLSSFVAPIIGIPFLLDILQVPADMMELFVMSAVYTDRIRVVPGAVHLFCLTVVAIAMVPMGYPLPDGDNEWSGFVSTWVQLEQKNGSVGLLFEHWIRGGGAKDTEPRWSIIRDVLHWID